MAHQYQRNMLDRKMTITGEMIHLGQKQELTEEDLSQLIDNCRRLEIAARHHRTLLQEQ